MCATAVSILCTIVAETEEHNDGQRLLPLGRLIQFHPYHILASYFPVIQANQSPGSFMWILPKRFPSTGRTHFSGLPSYLRAPDHRSLLYNTNPLYNTPGFPSCNIKFPANIMLLVTKYFSERCVFKCSVKTADIFHTNKNCHNFEVRYPVVLVQ